MRNKQKSVAFKIVFIISVLAGIIAISQPVLTAIELKKLINNIKEQHDASVNNLANNITGFTEWASYILMQKSLIFNLKSTDMVFGHVLKINDKRSIADANPALAGEIIESDFFNEIPSANNLITEKIYKRTTVWNKKSIHEYIVPLKVKGGRFLYFLHVGYSNERINSIKKEIYTKSIAAVLFSCVLGIGLWLSLKKYIVSPLKSLTDDVELIASNQSDKFKRVGDDDELSMLSDTLNRFLGETKEKQKLEVELAGRIQEIKDRKTYLSQLQYFGFWIAHDMEKQLLKLPTLENKSEKLNRWNIFREFIGNTCDRLKEVSKETETINASIARSEIFDFLPSIIEMLELFKTENPKINFDLKILSKNIIINGDPYLLRSCLTNLINNALDAIKSTGNPGKIQVKVRTEKLHTFISVTDNGCGMDLANTDMRHRIFMPFFSTKIKSGDEKRLNSGLGLHYVNEIIVAHGGIIRVDSSLGKGTTFELNIPLHNIEKTHG